jgi:hypothetical protein
MQYVIRAVGLFLVLLPFGSRRREPVLDHPSFVATLLGRRIFYDEVYHAFLPTGWLHGLIANCRRKSYVEIDDGSVPSLLNRRSKKQDKKK